MIKMVRLGNGREIPEILFLTTIESIKVAADKSPLALYELLMKARDSCHEIFTYELADNFRNLALLDHDFCMTEAVRGIVLDVISDDSSLVFPVDSGWPKIY